MFDFIAEMINSKLLEKTKEKKSIFIDNLYKGACVKIKNNDKTFQVIGLNKDKKICWVREWPFDYNFKKTFPLDISQIKIQVFCSNNLNKEVEICEINNAK